MKLASMKGTRGPKMDPSNADQTLTVGFLNILGQSKLKQSKQDQIQFILQYHKIDILHLQETNILEGAFDFCPFIANNYQILAQNNDSGFGVCSLVHKKLATENEILHPSGRLIAFDVCNLTMINVYLPSGAETSAKNQREEFCGVTIPNLLLHGQKSGLIGGDWNNITNPADCSHHPEQKVSPTLKKVISLLKWKDCYRLLHPKSTTYSHHYNRQMAGQGLVQGGSRLDRAYRWGEVQVLDAGYSPVAFSDHMLHLVSVVGPATSYQADPRFQPYFKIRPDIAKDDGFKLKVSEIVLSWSKAKAKMPLLEWWDLVKRDIRQEAKKLTRERSKNKKARLNFLLLAQIHLSKKVSKGQLSHLPKLREVQLMINEWFEEQAEKIKLHAKLHDIEDSEKVRIYHHEQLYRASNRSSITKLKAAEGLITGHRACADLLNKQTEDLLGAEAPLSQVAQEALLDGVEGVFTDKDNEMLEKEITNEEVWESLKCSNINSAPGSDGISFVTYVQCWSSLGSHLCEVLREVVNLGKPSTSMRHSFLVFSPKVGKSSSVLTKDKRRLALLQTDHKILSGILAARLRKTESHTLSPHQFAAGPRRITHAICLARDTINNFSPHQKGAALFETDFESAYDFLAVKWIWKVLERKKCSQAYIGTLKAIYEVAECYVINIINNEQQKPILNRRKNIRQGDRTSTILFAFGIDPLLGFLSKRLQGHVYHKLAAAGPNHPLFGPPRPVEAKLKVIGFVDDLKGVITSAKEFETLDKALRLFEQASGSRLHRDPATKKCQVLPLGRWSNWKQSDVPLDYMAVVDEINLLGVKLARNIAKTRATNGDELTKKVQTTIGCYKAGRFSPLVCRPYTANTFVMSKISYRSSVVNLRLADTNKIQAMVKQWITQHLLLKPPEVLLFREVEEGGLALVNTAARCTANLLKNFVEQAHPLSHYPNVYLNSLYRSYVTEELVPPAAKRPSFYSIDFFQMIKEAIADNNGDILHISTRGWQKRVLERSITHIRDPATGLPELIKTPQEAQLQESDWVNAWSTIRCQGLSPTHKSLLFQFANGLLVNNERLHKIGKLQSPKCDFCDNADVRCHLFRCEFNSQVGVGLLNLLDECCGRKIVDSDLGICNLPLSSHTRLPALLILCESIKLTQESRSKKQQIVPAKFIAHITATASVYNSAKKHKEVASSVVALLEAHFWPITPPTRPCSSSHAVPRPPHPQPQSSLQMGWGATQVMNFHSSNIPNAMHPKGAAAQAFLGPDLPTATSQSTAVPPNAPSCPAAPVDHVRHEGVLTNAPLGGGDQRGLDSLAALRGGAPGQRVNCLVHGSPHHLGGRPDPLLSHQKEGGTVLCEGHTGTCHGTGGHGPATPDDHGTPPWLPPLGPVRDPVPGSSSSSSVHQRDRDHLGPDPAAPAAVHRAGKSAWNPEARPEISGGPRSLPPQPVPTGLSQIEMSEKIVL